MRLEWATLGREPELSKESFTGKMPGCYGQKLEGSNTLKGTTSFHSGRQKRHSRTDFRHSKENQKERDHRVMVSFFLAPRTGLEPVTS